MRKEEARGFLDEPAAQPAPAGVWPSAGIGPYD